MLEEPRVLQLDPQAARGGSESLGPDLSTHMRPQSPTPTGTHALFQGYTPPPLRPRLLIVPLPTGQAYPTTTPVRAKQGGASDISCSRTRKGVSRPDIPAVSRGWLCKEKDGKNKLRWSWSKKWTRSPVRQHPCLEGEGHQEPESQARLGIYSSHSGNLVWF